MRSLMGTKTMIGTAAMAAMSLFLLAGCGGGGSGSSGSGSSGSSTANDNAAILNSTATGYVGEQTGGASSDPAVCSSYTPQVTVTRVTPNHGPVGVATQILIEGSGFSRCSPSTPFVAVSDFGLVRVLRYTDTQIVGTVPIAPEPITTNVIVSVKNPSGNNPNRPPDFKGTDGGNTASPDNSFTYE